MFLSQTQLDKRQKARQGDIFGTDFTKTPVLASPSPSLTPKPTLTVAAALAPLSEKRKKKKKSKKSKPSEGGLVAY